MSVKEIITLAVGAPYCIRPPPQHTNGGNRHLPGFSAPLRRYLQWWGHRLNQLEISGDIGMSYFFFKHNSDGESIPQRLVRFELFQSDNRPIVQFRQDEKIVEEPIIAYGQFEGEDGEQTIAPLILNPQNGQLEIICECCNDLVGFMPPIDLC